jgi:cardiolipin hydrolase
MPRILLATLAVVLLLVVLPGRPAHPGPAHRSRVVSVFFSPHGEAREALLTELRRAKKSIHVAMYILTDGQLADTLQQRAASGVAVRVLLDDHQARSSFSRARELTRAEGVQVRRLRPVSPPGGESEDPPRMHHKFCVVDGRTVLTGSYNWTVGAETRNHEDLLVLHMQPVASAYERAFVSLWQEADGSR